MNQIIELLPYFGISVLCGLLSGGIYRMQSRSHNRQMNELIREYEAMIQKMRNNSSPLPGSNQEPVLCQYQCEKCEQWMDHYTPQQAAAALYELTNPYRCEHKMKLIGPA